MPRANAGFQFEPYLELKGNVYEGKEKDVVTGGFLKVASFSHFQSVAAPIKTNYYGQDVYLSGGLVLLRRATLESGWNLYAYPAIGSSAQVQEVFGEVSFDDGGLWPFKLPGDQDVSFSPYVLVAGGTSGGAPMAPAYCSLHMLRLGPKSKLHVGPPGHNALNALNVTGGKGFEVWGITGIRIEN